MNTFSWFLIFLAGINSTLGNILLKKSQLATDFFSSLFSLTFIGGCFFYFMNVLLFAYALKTLDVSKAYPVLAGTSFITLASVGMIFMKENLSLVNLFGISLVLLGILLITQ